MGEELKKVNKEHEAELLTTESEISALVKSREWEYSKAAVDAAGLVDPTPISDGIGSVMSLAEGDLIGAGLSAVSMLPYLGDAIAKTAKSARAVRKLRKIAEAIGKRIKKLDALKFKLRKGAAKRVRRARREAIGSVEECAKEGRWGSRLPTTGTWTPKNAKGHGTWTSENGTYSVEYKEGYPDFSTAKAPRGAAVYKGKVEIEMTGNNANDFRAADKEWERIHGEQPPDGYTWHHSEDGTSMELVRSDVHDQAQSGAAHAGGASLVNSKEY